MWGFSAVRAAAIAKLSEMTLDPIDKVILAKKHNVDRWLIPALNELAQREAPLDIKDALRLEPVVGLEFILKLAQVRESSVTVQSSMTSSEQNALCQPCKDCTCAGRKQSALPRSESRATHDYTQIIHAVYALVT